MKRLNSDQQQTDDINALIAIFPPSLGSYIHKTENKHTLNEVVLDLGAPPELRFETSTKRLPELGDVTQEDITHTITLLRTFNTDNRTGIERTLHRISAIKNREGNIIGLTCRIGRAIVGTVNIIQEIIESGKSCLFLGPPGTGKTTLLRETARVLSVNCHKRVIVVDTSNEIGGDGDIPHPGIGYSRRMQVPSPDQQHATMIEAVENHTPECIIVDEIGTEEEAMAARTISQRGVQLIASAHGTSLENLIKNPTLCDLLGGIQSVVLGDEEAKFRGTNKAVLERKNLPTFDILIELRSKEVFVVYDPLKEFVDAMLFQDEKCPEFRNRTETEMPSNTPPTQKKTTSTQSKKNHAPVHVYVFGIGTTHIQNAAKSLDVPIHLCQNINDADYVLTLHSKMNAKSKLNQMLKHHTIDVHALRENTQTQVTTFFRDYFKLPEDLDHYEEEVLRETTLACEKAQNHKRIIELTPQSTYLRKLQHDHVHTSGLNSMSIGEEPNRRVRIYPVHTHNKLPQK